LNTTALIKERATPEEAQRKGARDARVVAQHDAALESLAVKHKDAMAALEEKHNEAMAALAAQHAKDLAAAANDAPTPVK